MALPGHLQEEEEDELLLERPPALVGDEGEEVAGLAVLHHHVDAAAFGERLDVLHYVGVLQLRQQLHLPHHLLLLPHRQALHLHLLHDQPPGPALPLLHQGHLAEGALPDGPDGPVALHGHLRLQAQVMQFLLPPSIKQRAAAGQTPH